MPNQPKPPDPRTVEAWEAYATNPSAENRNRLAEIYLPNVRRIASVILAKLPVSVELDELVHEGLLGMLPAIAAYDPTRAKFETYSARRIRGAILDYLRNLDWSSRQGRKSSKAMEAAKDKFFGRYGRSPTHAEVIKAMKLSRKEAARLPMQMPAMLSLQRPRFGSSGDGRQRSEAELAATREQAPFDRVAWRADLNHLIRSLPRAERLIVLLYYAEGLTMREIGLTLGLSESRVSQMHTALCRQLKAELLAAAAQAGRELPDGGR